MPSLARRLLSKVIGLSQAVFSKRRKRLMNAFTESCLKSRP